MESENRSGYDRQRGSRNSNETVCLEALNLHMPAEFFVKLGNEYLFYAEYFPDIEKIKPVDCAYELRVPVQKDFAGLYLPQRSNAFCAGRKAPDVIEVGSCDDEKFVALAGASAGRDAMWQIGVNVLPGYRRQGFACEITSRPYIKIPARVAMTIKPCAVTDEMKR